jgi:Stage III sporulation protein AE (spore_III_AE).
MKQILIILFIIPLFFSKAYADEYEQSVMDIFDASEMSKSLSEEEAEISGELFLDSYDSASALSRLWHFFFGKIKTELRAGFSFAGELIGVLLLCAFCCAACQEDKIRGLIEICGVCASAVILTESVGGLIKQTTEAIFRLSDYSKAALPVVFTAAAAGGAVSSAAARYAAASLCLDIMMSFSQKSILPLIYAALSLALANAVFPNPLLAGADRFCRWAAKTVMTASALSFTAYLKISSLISTSVDAAALKATRSVISGVLPVVGGMISDASAAVLSAAGVVRSCTGAFGLMAVSAICAGPFAILTVKCLLFKAVGAIAESVQNPRLQKLFAGVGSIMGLLMGLLGSNAIMLFLSFTAGMKAVTA